MTFYRNSVFMTTDSDSDSNNVLQIAFPSEI